MIALPEACERCGRTYQPTAEAVEWIALPEQTSGAPTYCGGCRRAVCEVCLDAFSELCLDCSAAELPLPVAPEPRADARDAKEPGADSRARSWLRRHPHVIAALAGLVVLGAVLLVDGYDGTGGEVAREPPPLGGTASEPSEELGAETAQPEATPLTPTRTVLEQRFDEVSMSVPIEQALSGVSGVEGTSIAAFPTAVDRSLRLPEGEPTAPPCFPFGDTAEWPAAVTLDWYSDGNAPELALSAGGESVLSVSLEERRELEPSRWYRTRLALPAASDDARVIVVDRMTDEVVVDLLLAVPDPGMPPDAVCIEPTVGAETYLDNLVVEQ